MRQLSLFTPMSYIVTERFTVVSLSLLAAAILAIPASAQTDASVAGDACVSTAMIGLLRRERGNSVRVSRSTELASERAGSGENEKGIALAQAQDTHSTLQQAHYWFEKGARKGYAPAQVNLAVLSLAGWGTPPSAGTAIYWLREAARQGYALAYFDLGVLYMNGCGVPRDHHEAFSQFEQGAKAGDSAAQTNLGYLYDQGLGVAEDRAQAAVWYRKAAESGVAEAQYNLADLYVRGEGVPRDQSTAFAWFQKAAQQGHTGACIMLSFMYTEGLGAEKDLQSAFEWLSAATLQGDTRGTATLQALEHELTPEQLDQSKMRAQLLAQLPKPYRHEIALLH
jgi:TPR repeat protein